MKDMKELFAKKKKISDNERDAKMSVLKEVSDMAGSAMGDKLKGLKKVSVAAPDKKGLELGLKKAEEMIGGPESESEEESPEHEDSESPEMESSEDADMLEAHKECPGCSECIDAKLAELSKKKEELQKSE